MEHLLDTRDSVVAVVVVAVVVAVADVVVKAEVEVESAAGLTSSFIAARRRSDLRSSRRLK